MEILKLIDVNKFYGSTHALKILILALKRAKLWLFQDLSGCGKSTQL